MTVSEISFWRDTMRLPQSALVILIPCSIIMTACGTSLDIGADPGPCGTPPPAFPTPAPAWLVYPPNGSINVSTSIGQIVEVGGDEPAPVSMAISVSTRAGQNVPIGTASSAPSPLPSPFSTPPPFTHPNQAYVAIPVPTLSPNTTYLVSDTYLAWQSLPPCATGVMQSMAIFSTGPT